MGWKVNSKYSSKENVILAKKLGGNSNILVPLVSLSCPTACPIAFKLSFIGRIKIDKDRFGAEFPSPPNQAWINPYV